MQPSGLTLQEGTQFFKPPMKKGLILQMVSLGFAVSFGYCILEIEALLTKFASIFETPTGLPPSRGHKHQILLKDGVAPVFPKAL